MVEPTPTETIVAWLLLVAAVFICCVPLTFVLGGIIRDCIRNYIARREARQAYDDGPFEAVNVAG